MPLMRAALDAAGRRVDGFTLALAALSALGAGLVLAREVTYGVGLTWDALTYISTAESLLAGDGFVALYGWRYHWHPPLYPLLLAGAGLGAVNPYAVAGPLNAVIFGLTIFVAGRLALRLVRNSLLAAWACVGLALSLPLAAAATQALSEPLFILCVTLSLLHSVRYFEAGRRSALLWAAVFASLAFLTRYTGITLILTMTPLLLLQRGLALPEKARRLGGYLAVAGLPVAGWLGWNYLAYGQVRGEQAPPWDSLGEVLQKYLSDLSGWLLLYQPSGEWGAAAAAALTALALAALAGVVAAAWFKLARNSGGGTWIGCAVFGGFGMAYLGFLAVTQAFLAGTAPLGGRHLIAAYIPLLLAAVMALDGIFAAGAIKKPLSIPFNQLFNRTFILKWGG